MTDTIPEAVIETLASVLDKKGYSGDQADVIDMLNAAQALGYKLVPVEPTEAMLAAALQPVREPLRLRASDGAWLADHSVGYRAMIAASPEVW